MTPEDFATCFVPIPLRSRHVIAGDAIVSEDNKLWPVVEIRGNAVDVLVPAHGAHAVRTFTVDPDDVVQVLTPVPMADAMVMTREQLGARVIERRTTKEAAA